MLKILHTDTDQFPLSSEVLARAARWGYELKQVVGHDPETLAREGADCAGAILYFAYVDDALLSRLPKWRILARVGTGYDRLNVRDAARRGVLVTNVPGGFTEELSNQVLMFVLAFSHQLPFIIAAAANRWWPPVTAFPPSSRLSQQSIGIVGFGPSGQAAAGKAKAFGMRVVTWSRTKRPSLAAALGVHEVALEEALACDYVSLNLALNADTANIINRDSLRHFSPSAVLINISRGELVDTAAMIEALRDGRLRGAGLDVVYPQPLPPDHPLWDVPNVLLTMHTAALSGPAQRAVLEHAIDDVGRCLGGEPVAGLVPEWRPLV
jgi:phosphoglycerate dehydrogenase-like enzyme